MPQMLRWRPPSVWRSLAALAVLGVGIQLSPFAVEAPIGGPVSDPALEVAYSEAAQARRWERALTVSAAALAQDPSSSRWHALQATALVYAADPEKAVDHFARVQSQEVLSHDRAALYAQAKALLAIRAYVQARATMRLLAERFPYSRLAAKDEEVLLAIEQRLAKPITADNLTWYLDGIYRAQARRLPGLALAFAMEYQHLAGYARRPIPPAVPIQMSIAAIALGRYSEATQWIRPVPSAAEDWQAGLIQATLARIRGEDISGILHDIEASTTSSDIRTGAQRLRQ